MLKVFYNDANTVTVPTTLPFVGLYIPIADLPGMEATELAVGVSEKIKEGKTFYSILQRINNHLSSAPNILGLSPQISNPVIINPTTISLTYSLTVDYLVNVSSGKVKMIPPPTTGVFSGIGKVSLKNIFPNCFTVKSTNNTGDESGIGVAGAGVLISTEDLAEYGFFNDVEGSTISTINLTEDNRYAISSIYQSITDGNVAVRTSTTPSGITTVTISNASVVTIPTSYYASSNPLSGIAATDLDHLSITRRTYGVTFELNLLPQYLEINPVTL